MDLSSLSPAQSSCRPVAHPSNPCPLCTTAPTATLASYCHTTSSANRHVNSCADGYAAIIANRNLNQ